VKSTKNIKISEKIVDQVIGQDEAVKIIKKAAQQRRHVLLIGEPGTGKSMMGLALAELLPKSELKDILSIHNPNDENNPKIQELPAGTGREEVKKGGIDSKQVMKNNNFLLLIVAIITFILPWWARNYYKSDVMFAALFLGGMVFLAAFAMMLSMGPRLFKNQNIALPPKLIVDNYGKEHASFFDATGSHAGALLGDVLHDPLQCFSGNTKLSSVISENLQVNKVIASMISRNKNNVYRKEKNNYEAVFLPKGELTVLGENNYSVSAVEVLSCNRHSHNGEMIKLTTSENKELIVTPEHAIAIWKHGKISYVEARDVKKGDEVVVAPSKKEIKKTLEKRDKKILKSYKRMIEEGLGAEEIMNKLGIKADYLYGILNKYGVA
jgi:ATP-dependent Lon protease